MPSDAARVKMRRRRSNKAKRQLLRSVLTRWVYNWSVSRQEPHFSIPGSPYWLTGPTLLLNETDRILNGRDGLGPKSFPNMGCSHDGESCDMWQEKIRAFGKKAPRVLEKKVEKKRNCRNNPIFAHDDDWIVKRDRIFETCYTDSESEDSKDCSTNSSFTDSSTDSGDSDSDDESEESSGDEISNFNSPAGFKRDNDGRLCFSQSYLDELKNTKCVEI